MPAGIDTFSKHFSDYKDQYVIIGGTACELLLSEGALDFRLTRDIDMVLIIEALTEEFVRVFWDFIRQGGYEVWTNQDGKPKFYRFVQPSTPNYPYMIELFARPGNKVTLEYKGHLMPIHISNNISSLSAILLNDDYYHFMLDGRLTSGSVTVLDAEHIVPLKMRAWLDLTRQKSEGIHVNDKDIRKHRQDVFRLFPLISADAKVRVPSLIYQDIQRFIAETRLSAFDLKSIHMLQSKEIVLDFYEQIYTEDGI